jgi:adenylosuccinate synthase
LEPLNLKAVLEEKLDQYAHIREVVREPFGLLHEALSNQDAIMLEGAQGALLDNNWGTYPFCTASITIAGGAAAGLGIPPHSISRVIGVAKAYTTRVGAGPMPTELTDEIGETLQREGQEYGTVTKRPRRCGWFDAQLVRFTTQLNGVTELALTKLDVLDTLPTVKICVGYQRGDTADQIWHYWEGDATWLGQNLPVYIELDGWQQPTSGVRDFAQLPPNAQDYVRKIEKLVGVPVKFVSVGPARKETIIL